MNAKKLGLLAGLIAIIVGVVGFFTTRESTQKNEDKIQAVATFYPIYEITKEILGENGQVDLLIKAGIEVHGFEPSTKDLTKIQDADVFVYADENMETWVPDLTQSIDTKKVNVIEATGNMLLMAGGDDHHDHSHEDGHSHAYDPHVWVSPERAMTLVDHIASVLSEKYPEKAEAFQKNAATYREKLQKVDEKYRSVLSAAKQKSFVTQHTAFAYLALDYGLNQVSITGISADQEPTSQRLAELTKYIKDQGIQYIYFEENASSSISETLAKEAGVKTAVLNPLESLTKEKMDAGETYLSTLESNLEALKLTTEIEGKTIEPEEVVAKTVYAGYFEDSAITDRSLSDWSGEWQSVYPFLVDGTMDQVWDYKAKKSQGKTSKEAYKEEYTAGYKTDVEKITIDGDNNTMEFIQNGKSHKFTYKYVGYEVLTYKKGNRGVRFLFETDDANAGDFKYVQFSDHNISTTDSGHFHLYWRGTSQEDLLTELVNWPTYYPADMTGQEIAQEIVAH